MKGNANMTKTFVAAAILLLCAQGGAFAQGAANPAAAPAASGDAGKGKALFTADGCYECHDYAGEGSLRTGPAIARPQFPYEAFLSQLRDPMNAMPVYTQKVLPDSGARDIYAYLQSLPPSPNAKSIPELQN
jgi:mono/diheme cytochrome c family protein